MRKRKKPIVLLTILGVLGAAVIGFNAMQTPSGDSHDHDAPQAENHEDEKPVLTTPRAAGDGKTAASDAVAKMGGPASAPEAPKAPPGRPGGPKASMLRSTPMASKPKPTDSATSGQWWTDEANKKVSNN